MPHDSSLPAPPPRGAPQQARSQRRLDAILHAAQGLLPEVGYEGFSTKLVARRAGVAVGTLYQFFPHKDALLYALAEANLAALATTLDALFTPDVDSLALPVLADRVVSALITFTQQHPSSAQVIGAAWLAPDARARQDALFERLVARIAAALAARAPHHTTDRLHVAAKGVLVLLDGLLPHATWGTPAQQAQLRADFTRLLAHHMADVIAEGHA